MEKDRIDLLENTLKQVNDWLKFAEAKNGALLAIGCAIIFGVLRLLPTLDNINFYLMAYISNLLILTTASVVVALMSFIPRMEPPFWITMPEKSDKDNPLFFGHACKYSKNSYLDLFNNVVESSEKSSIKIESALCDQIVNNSKIAFIKYSVFSSSIFLLLAGTLTPFGAIILYWVKN